MASGDSGKVNQKIGFDHHTAEFKMTSDTYKAIVSNWMRVQSFPTI